MSRLLGIAFTAAEIPQFEGFAKALSQPMDIVLLTGVYESNSAAEKILTAALKETPTSDSIDSQLAELAKTYTHIAAVSSMATKDLLPRIAAKLDAAMVTDVIEILGPNLFKRPLQAGAVVGTVETTANSVVMTFRPANFEKITSATSPSTSDYKIDPAPKSQITANSGGAATRPDLSQANFVISGGRPLKDAATFEKVIGGFADAFGGAVGATRAAVDSGIAPNETQVGQTGKIVAPHLYIAAGISGSTQHVAGIKDSKLIVAINKDPDAPIFEAADLGLVGDLFDVLPALQAELKKGRG